MGDHGGGQDELKQAAAELDAQQGVSGALHPDHATRFPRRVLNEALSGRLRATCTKRAPAA